MRAWPMRRHTAAMALVMMCVAAEPARSQPPRVIRITAERFVFSPSKIVVDAGEEVELRLMSDDTSHGFRITGTGVNVVIPKRGREETRVTLKAPAPGRYTFECNRMCGAGHNFMRGVLVVRDRVEAGQR